MKVIFVPWHREAKKRCGVTEEDMGTQAEASVGSSRGRCCVFTGVGGSHASFCDRVSRALQFEGVCV